MMIIIFYVAGFLVSYFVTFPMLPIHNYEDWDYNETRVLTSLLSWMGVFGTLLYILNDNK